MKFGGMVATKIDDWGIFPYPEELKFDSGWVPDSQMIWSDCYATLSLAAQNTHRLRIGTGVAIAGTRLAPVTAHSIASINKLAPGRVFLGIGSGHTAMRIMGQNPVSPTEFSEYLRIVRGLLAGDEVDYCYKGKTQPIKFLERDLSCVDIENKIPLYVAANGPKALRAAGVYGDGRIGAGNEPKSVFLRNSKRINCGAAEVGRVLPEDFHSTVMTFACVLRPGEKLNSERVIEETGAQVVASLHFWYELFRQKGHDNFVIDSVRDVWNSYKIYVEKEMPLERRHLLVHQGHCANLPDKERRFVTPSMIKVSGGLVGEPDELVARIQELEEAGLKEIVLMPPRNSMRTNFKVFAREIIAKL
ncbi:MAG: hypothetical protein CMM32_10400 [Rhodospirillaceae bacterium]|nr:hypothetical protein [Rhodospirillaceae bacterium]